MALLFTNDTKVEVPWAYLELQLCRDVYHCTPSELGKQDWEKINKHLFYMSIERKVQAFKNEIKR